LKFKTHEERIKATTESLERQHPNISPKEFIGEIAGLNVKLDENLEKFGAVMIAVDEKKLPTCDKCGQTVFA